MKTPREIILERHRAAEEKLKTISEQDLAAYAQTAAIKDSEPFVQGGLRGLAMRFWVESIRPWRRIWVGCAAVWLGIVMLHMASGESIPSATIEAARPNPQVISVLLQQKQLLVQLLEPSSSPKATQPKSPPRSELRHELFIMAATQAMA